MSGVLGCIRAYGTLGGLLGGIKTPVGGIKTRSMRERMIEAQMEAAYRRPFFAPDVRDHQLLIIKREPAAEVIEDGVPSSVATTSVVRW